MMDVLIELGVPSDRLLCSVGDFTEDGAPTYISFYWDMVISDLPPREIVYAGRPKASPSSSPPFPRHYPNPLRSPIRTPPAWTPPASPLLGLQKPLRPMATTKVMEAIAQRPTPMAPKTMAPAACVRPSSAKPDHGDSPTSSERMASWGPDPTTNIAQEVSPPAQVVPATGEEDADLRDTSLPAFAPELGADYNSNTGILILGPRIGYKTRHYGRGAGERVDDPTAEFSDPQASKKILEGVANVLKCMKPGKTAAVVFRPTGRKPREYHPHHAAWLQELYQYRAQLLGRTLEDFGVPPDRLRVSAGEFSPEGPSGYVELSWESIDRSVYARRGQC